MLYLNWTEMKVVLNEDPEEGFEGSTDNLMFRCKVCGRPTLNVCHCKEVFYCCKEHQEKDWYHSLSIEMSLHRLGSSCEF